MNRMRTFTEKLSPKMRLAIAPFVLGAALTACDTHTQETHSRVNSTVDGGSDAGDAGSDGSTDGGDMAAIPTEGPNADFDEDGIPNGDDTCPRIFNAKDPVTGMYGDADGDAVWDECDLCPTFADPTNNSPECLGVGAADSDNDGKPDARDNCLSKPNPDQKDTDGDGNGDVCDTCGPNDPAVWVEITSDECASHVQVGTVITGNENNILPCQHSEDTSVANGQGGTMIQRTQDAVLPTDEVADGQDNDCDNAIDEGYACNEFDADGNAVLRPEGFERVCGPAAVGECAPGTQRCIDGQFSVCDTQSLPTDETLDGKDNDCDGTADNGFGGRACRVPPGNADGVTRVIFDEETQSLREVCEPSVALTPERCDGVDNDNDGLVDEDLPLHNGATTTLTASLNDEVHGRANSACEGMVAIAVCDANGNLTVAEIAPAGAEVCGDDIDNDCDGSIDESGIDANGNVVPCVRDGEVPGTQIPCEIETGECSQGVQTVDATGARGVCQNAVGPQAEKCDGLDNDCDGSVDEDFDKTTPDPSMVIQDGCAVRVQCTADGSGVETIRVLKNAPEICNGKDDDCDGKIDNPAAPYNRVDGSNHDAVDANNVHLTGTPEVGQNSCVGLTQNSPCDVRGKFVCADENNVVCDSDKKGVAERCDGIDNNCNGQIDENNGNNLACQCEPGATQACGPDAVGECAPGTQTCDANGRWGSCADAKFPSAEICDNKDNDCNGVTDDDYNVGVACNPLNPGCDQGAVVCVANGSACAFNSRNASEVADGLDNNCNGSIDEAALPITGLDGNRINGQTGVVDELCDGEAGACAGTGLYVATDGLNGQAVHCSTLDNASVETPNGIDDDCDGTADEGFDCVTDATQPCNDFNRPAPCRPGSQTCNAQGQWGACQGEVSPRVENQCDGIDNDCDGNTDPVQGTECSITNICADGSTRTSIGVNACNAQGQPVCTAPALPPCPPVVPAAPSAAPSMGQ